ncbi:MAG TPA: acetyl-CoA hydrolase/transferase C-terminal domain-containing protein [Acidimicrobiales bacterium]|nr:acetyl-CoA hydrolase/transferase C-terminal domain-containing protein [Acidimicrobiales bacterium]
MAAPPRPLIALADGPDGPLPEPETIAAMAGIGSGPDVLLGWVVRDPGWLEADRAGSVTTLMVGAGTRRAVASGRVRPVAARLSAIPRLVAGRLRPAVAVVGGYEEPATGRWRLAGSPGWALSAARAAAGVVIERWPGPPPPGRHVLPECRVLGVYDRGEPPDPPPVNRTGEEHRAIGRMVADLIPARATIQWGPGSIGAAVVAALHRPVRVRSGLVTDELVELVDRGLLIGAAEAAYLWGGPGLQELVARGRLRLRELDHTHDLTAISADPCFVAINTAIQVGLDGAVNVERVGGRTVAGPGGHPDFAAGASRSPGGLSIVALVAASAGRSNIVAAPEVVSTPRFDVDVVVTEHGVADLRGCGDNERAERLIAVAAPEHRAGLLAGP